MQDQTFENVPVPEGTVKLTVVVYNGRLAILAVADEGSFEVEQPIFDEALLRK